ncbi:MAG: DNA glycosylase AlkZ-like family protein [Streptosporangiaceae bacterium]
MLVEGYWTADWAITRSPDRAVLQIRPFGPLSAAGQAAVAAEGSRLLEFAAPAAAHDVRFGPAHN